MLELRVQGTGRYTAMYVVVLAYCVYGILLYVFHAGRFVPSLKLKPNKALDENSSLSYGASRHLSYGITQCYLPPDTSERWYDLP